MHIIVYPKRLAGFVGGEIGQQLPLISAAGLELGVQQPDNAEQNAYERKRGLLGLDVLILHNVLNNRIGLKNTLTRVLKPLKRNNPTVTGDLGKGVDDFSRLHIYLHGFP